MRSIPPKKDKRAKGVKWKDKPRGPHRFLVKLAEDLFSDETERAAFLRVMEAGDAKEQAIVVLDPVPQVRTFPRLAPLKWQPDWVHRIEPDFKPSKHPLYAKGAYYSLDFSSVFSASAMLAIPGRVGRILDLCASPGGKSVFAWKVFSPDLLLCNETIRKRATTLIQNLHRCGITHSAVWSADPSVYAKRYSEGFDLVICDAPCSGQSLLAKGDKAPGCFDSEMIDMCVGRQRRITGNAVKCLRPGGYLLYATCTYGFKENEKVISWLLAEHPELEAVEVRHLTEFKSRYTDFPCYRLFPQQDLGAGAFVALLQKRGDPEFEEKDLGEVSANWRFGEPLPAAAIPVPKEETNPTPDTSDESAKPKAPKKKRAFRPGKPGSKKKEGTYVRKEAKKSRRGKGRSR